MQTDLPTLVWVAGDPQLAVGSLQDLRESGKGGMDPDSANARTALAADVLWSDPTAELGLQENASRGLGLLFGPDVTEVCLLPWQHWTIWVLCCKKRQKYLGAL